MNIHKFNTKPKTTQPKSIKVNSITWEIFSQEDIKLKV